MEHSLPSEPELGLDEFIYQQILKITFDVGKQFERLPCTYAGKEEEHLRDYFLLILEPNFEGSATDETFNKTEAQRILRRSMASKSLYDDAAVLRIGAEI